MAVELLLALPLLVGLLLAVVEFSLLLTIQQELIAASREGARAASQGGAEADVVNAAQLVLGPANLSSATVTAVLTDSMGQPLASGQPVSVLVSIPANQAVPDLLAFVGFSVVGDTIAGQTVMRKE